MSENPYGQNPPQQPPQPPPNPYGTGAGENPYDGSGQPTPSAAPPHGQQPYGQQPGQPPYGQVPEQQTQPNPYGRSPYGQQYGQQPMGGGPLGDGLDMYGRPLGSDERPASVVAAGWITLILSGLTALVFGFITLALLVAKDQIVTEINKELIRQDAYGEFNAEDAYGVTVGIMVVFTIWCVIACVLAVFAMRRSNVSRILLVVSAIVAGLLSLLAIGSVVSAVWLLACVAVVIMLFAGGANAWYGHRRRY